MLCTLMEYEDSTITHTIPDLIELLYCKASQTFQITTFSDDKVSTYDIDTACDVLYLTLNPVKKKAFNKAFFFVYHVQKFRLPETTCKKALIYEVSAF